jgi:hypothetical protein
MGQRAGMSPDRLGRLRRGGLAVVLLDEVGPAFGNSSQERPRSLSGPLLPWPRNEVAPTRLPLCKPSARGLKERDGRLVQEPLL